MSHTTAAGRTATTVRVYRTVARSASNRSDIAKAEGAKALGVPVTSVTAHLVAQAPNWAWAEFEVVAR